ncbi:MAG: PadR family transcriptional regulator [Micrococcales bacterium]|nr:PadR family transcriptional regulator [Micrococcales bacterium]
MEIEKELLRGNVDLLILAMLGASDLYGYELAKLVKARTEGTFGLKEGTVYLALKRLEAVGLVESYWGEGGVGARRKYYRLQPSGRARVTNLAAQWRLLTQVTAAVLSDAGFGDGHRAPSPNPGLGHQPTNPPQPQGEAS